MASSSSVPSGQTLPRACLRPLQQPPLDAITVYNTATHCYLLATDSLQRDYHLMTCRKHSIEQAVDLGQNTDRSGIGLSPAHTTASESDVDERGGGGGSSSAASPSSSSGRHQHHHHHHHHHHSHHAQARHGSSFSGLEDLHDHTSYAVYSPTEAASLVEALQREHATSMEVISAVALIGAVRFTEGYYLVLVTARRPAGHIGVHRLFEASQVELVSLLLDSDWVAAQMQQQQRGLRGLGESLDGRGSFVTAGTATPLSPTSGSAGGYHYRKQASSYRKATSSATAAAAAYLFQRRSLEEMYRQQFLSSLTRASSFFYSHSYDLTNTLQRNLLAEGAAETMEQQQQQQQQQQRHQPNAQQHSYTDYSYAHQAHVGGQPRSAPHEEGEPPLYSPRMQYVWNEYLLEPWQLPDTEGEADGEAERRGAGGRTFEASASYTSVDELFESLDRCSSSPTASQPPPPLSPRQQQQQQAVTRLPPPRYPPSFARWRVFLVHGYVTQRTVVVRRPVLHTLLLTLIARVSKASAGVRYLRRGVNSDGSVANHVEVEQLVSDESAWNSLFTDGALSSYVQLRGSVPIRWYHPPMASRLLPKPPIIIGPQDAEWSATCMHFQELLRDYGAPILAHDLLKRKESHTRESALSDAYRLAVQALAAAIARDAEARLSEPCDEAAAEGSQPPLCHDEGTPACLRTPLHSSDVIQYEGTDLRGLGPLAWNTMTAMAEHHFDQVRCFVCRRLRRPAPPTDTPTSQQPQPPTRDYAVTDGDCPSVATQLQSGVVRSNCLDCIDRTNLGQLFHGLHALGEQLVGLGLLYHAAELRESPAVTELLLEMYLAMGDALATQYGGSAQVGAGVLHRGAGWDQLMGVKRLYNNVMGDRDKQEAIKLLLGRTQPQPRRHSRARNGELHAPGQLLMPAAAYTAPQSGTTSLNTSMTSASPGVAEAVAAAMHASPSNASFASIAAPSSTRTTQRLGTRSSASHLGFASQSASGGVSVGATSSPSSAAPPPKSFFSGILQSASKWWGDATGSSAPSAASAAATAAAAALRAAQYAAAEAEAEPDYYENATSGPRLPPAGLLASWWVQPLQAHAAWYGARGICLSGGGEGDKRQGSQGMYGEHRSRRGADGSDSGVDQLEPPPSSSLRSVGASHSTTLASAAIPIPSAGSLRSPGDVTGLVAVEDAFALQLLASETAAHQRWLLTVARWERQACLTSRPRSSANNNNTVSNASVASSTTPFGGMAGQRGEWSSGSPTIAATDGTPRLLLSDRVGRLSTAAAVTGSVLRPSVSTWGMDEAVMQLESSGMPRRDQVGSMDSMMAASLGSFADLSLTGLSGYAGVGGVGGARRRKLELMDASAVPISLPLTPALFTEAWVVLRSTTHRLPVGEAHPSQLAAPSRVLSSPARLAEAAVLASPSPALQLLRSWRQEQRTAEHSSRGGFTNALLHNSNSKQRSHAVALPLPQDRAIAVSVARQLFGAVPSSITTALSKPWERQKVRVAESVHAHHAFPSLVRSSVFAQQEQALAELASCDTMYIADGAAVEGRHGTTPETRSPSVNSGLRQAAAHGRTATPHDGQRLTGRGLSQLQQQSAAAAATADSAMSTCQAEDQRFVARLLISLYGEPIHWSGEEVVLALERLLFPAPLPAAVRRLLRHSDLHPAITGAEVLTCAAAAHGMSSSGKDEGRHEYWRRRLSVVVAAVHEKATRSLTVHDAASDRPSAANGAAPLGEAAALLCRLCELLGDSAVSAASAPATANSSGPGGANSPAGKEQNGVASALLQHAEMAVLSAYGSTASLCALSDEAPSPAGATKTNHAATSGGLVDEDQMTLAAVAPLLQGSAAEIPPEVQLALISSDYHQQQQQQQQSSNIVAVSELVRRLWLLCGLLQPLLPSCPLTPSTLHRHLRELFAEGPPPSSPGCSLLSSSSSSSSPSAATGPRAGHHIRYTFALSPKGPAQQPPHAHTSTQQQQQQQVRSQLAAGAMTSTSTTVTDTTSGRVGREVHQVPSSSSSAAAGASTAAASGTASASLRAVHIPATLEVRCCCTSLQLYHWCRQRRTRTASQRAQKNMSFAQQQQQQQPSVSSTLPLQDYMCGHGSNSGIWRLLWWAVENNLVVPVVRRREQTTLDILADETALFCVVDNLSRVALNVERRSAGEVWRQATGPSPPSFSQTMQHQQQRWQTTPPSLTAGSSASRGIDGGGYSAIYGVALASVMPVHRLTRRSARTDMVALSETIANLALSAASRLQAFFRDHAVHGWTRTTAVTAAMGGMYGGGGGASSFASAGEATGSVDGGSSTGDGGAAEAAFVVTPAEVITHLYQLAEEGLQSIQSIMVALQFMSLEALAEDLPLHSYISFFVNTYNAAYVVAWLTNVKELISSAATAAENLRRAAGGAARADRMTPPVPTIATRAIDLLPLPTLCNTNLACFMHVYGVAIGHVFLSLAEMKYGILGGNRPPPYRDVPLWPSASSPFSSPRTSALGTEGREQSLGGASHAPASAATGTAAAEERTWRWWQVVPLHLRAEMPEAARIAALQCHPHVKAAVELKEACEVYSAPPPTPSPAATAAAAAAVDTRKLSLLSTSTTQTRVPTPSPAMAGGGASVTSADAFATSTASYGGQSSRGGGATRTAATAAKPAVTTTTSAPLFPDTTAHARRQQRYADLVHAWSTDVVRHLAFRVSLQLIDLYLPPPLFHLFHATSDSSTGTDGGIGVGSSSSAALDTHHRLDMDGERVPWYLQPLLRTMPLVHPVLQSSRLGVAYEVARDDDGPTRGTLVAQISLDANGVLPAPQRMWSSASYYVVGGDGVNGEEAIAHAFQLLQALSGSYLGINEYCVGGGGGASAAAAGAAANTTTTLSEGGDGGQRVQHLCAPLHGDALMTQLHATEATLRSALHSMDARLFTEVTLKSASTSSFSSAYSHFGLSGPLSCSAVLHSAMKPLMFEWCRTTDQGLESMALLAKPGSQLRVLLRVLRLLEDSYASGEGVRKLQASMEATV